jgi:hypothetical protein
MAEFLTYSDLINLTDSRAKVLPIEDDDEEAEERSCRAALVAVDFAFIIRQSSFSYVSPSRGSLEASMTDSAQPAYKLTTPAVYHLKDKTHAGPVAVLESQRPKHGSRANHLDGSFQAASREPKPKSSVLVHARSESLLAQERRSAGGARSFYFSNDTLGGKSPGYAWGYAGSFPRPEGSSGYARDRMKKGLDLDTYTRLAATSSKAGTGSRVGRRR